MDSALDVMTRALQGNPDARSFLERTTSVYLLDVTDSAHPKTYGSWNFIYQAINEVERHETQHPPNPHAPGLSSHVRLLASMLLRVARRSPQKEKGLVETCIYNAPGSLTDAQSKWLVGLNLEIREVVMGRVAAMALDFGFHRDSTFSAFADHVAMDTFCAVLSANAVASGPQSIQLFATEWIIPSSRSLPTLAVASVVLHLAQESMKRSVRAGTKDVLQQLSKAAMVVVLVPSLADAVTDNSSSADGVTGSLQRSESSRIAAICLRAMKAWCGATDLSLPQITHVCRKSNVSFERRSICWFLLVTHFQCYKLTD